MLRWGCRFDCGGKSRTTVRNETLALQTLTCDFWRTSRTKRSCWSEFRKKSRTKRSLCRLDVRLLEQVSYETLVFGDATKGVAVAPRNSAPRECRTRVSYKSPHKSVLQKCPTSVLQECFARRVSHKKAIQECPKRVTHESVLQECSTRASSYKTVPQECSARVSDKNVPQECPTKVS